MKRHLGTIICIALIFTLGTAAFAADTDSVRSADITYRGISIVVNGTKIVPQDASGIPVEPFIMDGSTFLPVRAIAGALGLEVGWDGETSTVILRSGGRTNYGSGKPLATNSIRRTDITFRDIKITLDGAQLLPTDASGAVVEPFILDGTTYLPVRGIANALDIAVDWDASTSTVYLTGEESGYTGGADGGRYMLIKETETGTLYGSEICIVTTYDYYPNGCLRSMSTGSTPELSDTTRYYYSDTCQLICETGPYSESSYTYDAAGNMTRTVTTGQDGCVSDYTYDANGNVLTVRTSYDSGGSDSRSYTYDANGSLLTSSYYYSDTAGWMQTLSRCEYDRDGYLVKEISSHSGDGFAYTETTTYEYSGGRMISFETSDGFGVSGTKYTYDSYGNILSERSYYNGALLSSTEYSYDINGYMTRSVHSYDGQTLTTIYEYAPMSFGR